MQDVLYMTWEGLLQDMGIICGHWAKQNMLKMEVHTSDILVTIQCQNPQNHKLNDGTFFIPFFISVMENVSPHRTFIEVLKYK